MNDKVKERLQLKPPQLQILVKKYQIDRMILDPFVVGISLSAFVVSRGNEKSKLREWLMNTNVGLGIKFSKLLGTKFFFIL
jgi:hypothetical protein